ncbi:MAG TPA: SRPBCC family protein [Nocardioidaceae bacterium]|jgi:carbon monoxide dehydrogenase subunit G
MELTHQFTVPAPVDVAWKAFNDLERIAPCFPGASLTSYDGDAFEGICKVKLGPISLQYAGSGRFVERDEATHRAVIEAKGRDKRGNGTAAANVTTTLAASGDDATDVTVTTDLSITGRPAQFGRGVMQDVSDKLLGQFAACLETKLGGEESTASAATAEPQSTVPEPESAAAESAATPIGAEAAAAVSASSAEPTEELDLGATVMPVLVKRYAPYVIGGLIALWLLKRLLRRS